MPGYSAAIAALAACSTAGSTSNGHEAPQRSGVAQRVQQQPGLLRRAAADLDQRLGAGDRGDLVGVLGQDRPLGAGRVVLGQPGDLVEQLAARGVVEVLGRQCLGVAVKPARTSAASCAACAVGVEMGRRAKLMRSSQVGQR